MITLESTVDIVKVPTYLVHLYCASSVMIFIQQIEQNKQYYSVLFPYFESYFILLVFDFGNKFINN